MEWITTVSRQPFRPTASESSAQGWSCAATQTLGSSEGARENVRQHRPNPMPQSLAKVYVHLVFSTKRREPIVPSDIRPELHACMGGILREMNCVPIEINTEPDHAHVLFSLARTNSLCDVVGHLKKGSTNWLHQQRPNLAGFYWQNGYGAFSVSQSQLEGVIAYIRNQREHHRAVTFQDEFRRFLNRHGIEWDEKFVWD